MEAYSARMLAVLTRQLQEADAAYLAQLLAYFRLRRGPGLALVEAEVAEREERRQTNYPPQAA